MKIKKIALATIITIGSLGLVTEVSADMKAEYDTKVNINFTENEETTNPVDPENPDKEITPEEDEDGKDPIDPGTNGPLSIDYASHINFGEVVKTGNAKIYYANPIKVGEMEERAPYVQVTDNRGTKTGWELQVAQTDVFKNGQSALEGASLSLENGAVNSNSATENVTSKDVTFKNHGQLYPVLTAEVDHGAGTFTNQFGKIVDRKSTSVSLSVPADLVIEDGTYSANLNWVLVDTP